MKKTTLSALLVGSSLALFTFAANADMLPEISVEETYLEETPSMMQINPENQTFAPKADGGDFLRSLPGVSGGRIGGHGTEPVINGQQQTQLNIVNDGAMVHGGCPNRMDPPTSFASPETFDTITVLRGYQTVLHGAGGTGGTVLFDREPHDFKGTEISYIGDMAAGYAANGAVRDAYADLAAGNEQAQIRTILSTTRANNYEDGDGNSVRSGFDHSSVNVLGAASLSENTQLELGYEYADTSDALFAGAGMDAPVDETDVYRMSLSHDYEGGWVSSVKLDAYSSLVDHVMDNFSLRTNTGMKMKTVAESDTFGGRLAFDFDVRGVPVTAGVDLQNNQRDAKRYSGIAMATDATTAQSYMWPDATIRQTGVFFEGGHGIGENARIKSGLRYDNVSAKAAGADTSFGAKTANTLYTEHYGITAKDKTEHNVGGLLRLEYDLGMETTFYAGLSRSVRTADATERFMAANSGVAASRWVGNPNLSPEKHHQIDAGVMTGGNGWSMSFNAYYDDVSDFIMRDRARGQDGIVASSNETIYRNIDATLAGVDVQGRYSLTPSVSLNAAVAYTYGENDEDGDELAQIPPVEGHIGADYKGDSWSAGSKVNFATKQTRIDDQTSSRDVGETDGYATLDLYGSVDITDGVALKFGMDNVLDNNYARHLNRSNAFDPVEVQINETGRTGWLRLSAKF